MWTSLNVPGDYGPWDVAVSSDLAVWYLAGRFYLGITLLAWQYVDSCDPLYLHAGGNKVQGWHVCGVELLQNLEHDAYGIGMHGEGSPSDAHNDNLPSESRRVRFG